MKTNLKWLSILLVMSFSLPMQYVHAGLFADDEARRHILDLREKKADKVSIVELSKQNEALTNEVTKLRGELEELNNKYHQLQESQKDFYLSVDDRLKKLEPQQATATPPQSADRKPTPVAYDSEKMLLDASDELYGTAEYKKAIVSYNKLIKQYPSSQQLAYAYHQVGNSYYMLKDYKSAMKNQRIVLKRFPKNKVASDAMLNISSCQIGLSDLDGAKKTLKDLVKNYPSSAAAKQAKARLQQLN